MGLTNALATFQQLMNRILHHKLDSMVMVYLDDILIYTKGMKEEHEKEAREVLQLLQDNHIMLNSKKSKYTRKEVTFLGTIISKEGLRMETEKTKAIREWPELRTVKEVQAFLGFANYYRRFIRNYSRYTTPLTKLTKKNQPFEWKEEQRKAFSSIKTLFTDDNMLQGHDPEGHLTMEILKSEKVLQEHDLEQK